MKTLLTRKLGMTSIISEEGRVSAVTLLRVSNNTITQIKDLEKDGYSAIQIGTEETKKLAKPQTGHVKTAGVNTNVMCEIRVSEIGEVKVGDKINADLFNSGDIVSVSGISKGKGFAGTIKRHNFKLGRKTHGGRSYRRPGSIGSMYPQKIFKGKKMSGQMGAKRVTTKNLKVALVDQENKVIGVYGSVPGPKKGLIVLSGEKK